ncbi:hypothetical protein TVD_03450 [Thioalkalivibrio versutus]|uniref:MFS transporter permease n=1 Tax=Thioalkalivibrio versutus TaxID=106634 RepID=A0A0G3G6I9_9GAMM|nr:DUF6064 family protein [Thioalkalivibrio versutus]AKJ94481.1 hypothetical protein TVD_03450 [Thioalkalivibrio versutus]
MLPFEASTWLAILGQYNTAIWPLHGIGALLALVAMGLVVPGSRAAGRVIGLLLGVLWIWTGVAFFGGSLAPFHFASEWLAGVFVAQGLMLVFALTLMGQARFGWPGGLAGGGAVLMIVYALVGYPLLDLALTGTPWTQLQYVGVAPGPVMLLTLGLLLLVPSRPPLVLAIIPLLWALVTGYMAWGLGLPLEYFPAVLGVASFAVLVALRFRRKKRRLSG